MRSTSNWANPAIKEEQEEEEVVGVDQVSRANSPRPVARYNIARVHVW